MHHSLKSLLALPLAAGVIFTCHPLAHAAALDRNGIGAASMGVGGASTASPQDSLSRMTQNAASLAGATGFEFQLGGTLAYAQGDFYQSGTRLGSLQNTWGILPDLAVTTALSDTLGIGFSITTDTSRLANWQFADTPGALAGAQYPQTEHRSEIVNLRAAVAVGKELGGGFSVGASVGAVYTRNGLQTPYIFQNNGLAGAKTFLDLQTQGVGVNGDVAIQWKVNDRLSLGLSYRTPTSFQTSGSAKGDIGPQLAALGMLGVDGNFRYDAKIKTALPQRLSAGFAAVLTERWRLMGQVDWINWSAAYNHLDVNLSNGTNGTVNTVAGSTGITDRIALNWKDQYVFRLGSEVDVTDKLMVRLGYVYGRSPVPSSTLLPMTAAISEHTLAFGMGWRTKTMSVDLAYQYDLPISRSASASSITGPEYKDTKVSVQAHWVGLTLGFKM